MAENFALSQADLAILDLSRIARLQKIYPELKNIEISISAENRILEINCVQQNISILSELQEDLKIDGWIVLAVRQIKIFLENQCVHAYKTLVNLNREAKTVSLDHGEIMITSAPLLQKIPKSRTEAEVPTSYGRQLTDLTNLSSAFQMSPEDFAELLLSIGVPVFVYSGSPVLDLTTLQARLFGEELKSPRAKKTVRSSQPPSQTQKIPRKKATPKTNQTPVEVAAETATTTTENSVGVKRLKSFLLGKTPKGTIDNILVASGATDDAKLTSFVLSALATGENNRFYNKLRDSALNQHGKFWVKENLAEYIKKVAVTARKLSKANLSEATEATEATDM